MLADIYKTTTVPFALPYRLISFFCLIFQDAEGLEAVIYVIHMQGSEKLDSENKTKHGRGCYEDIVNYNE